MACDPATLTQQSACFQCLVSGNLIVATEIVLLCALRDGETIPTDPQALVSQAGCILDCIPTGLLPAVKLAILCDIAANT
jgi:hypothetical protein